MRTTLRLLLLGAVLASAQAGAQPATDQERAQFAECKLHLQTIGRALAAYQRDRHSYPDQLSDLVPTYIADKSILHCPADQTRGYTGTFWSKEDSRLHVSYAYAATSERITGGYVTLGPGIPPTPRGATPFRSSRDSSRTGCR